MGCVQAKSMSMTSSPRGLEKLKLDHGYVGRTDAGHGSASNGYRHNDQIQQRNLPNGRAGGATEGGDAGIDRDGEGKAVKRVGQGEVGVSRRRASLPVQLEPAPVAVPPPWSPPAVGWEGGMDEMVGGWPRWLLENIPRESLARFVPKSAENYVMIQKVGQGTYSNVYKARERDTGRIVALKKVRFETSESESVRFMAREIMILQKLDHPNIVKLEGLATSRMNHSLYLVFEFMYSDLARIVSRHDVRLTEPQVKCYMQQLLSGLEHCHKRGILHRDIKGSNLLIDRDGRLKIADFGLANYFSPNQRYPLTSRVVTLWYRAPELILGATDYGVGIDLWSAGCLLAEMFAGRPILPGRTEIEQLHRICKLCGTPSEDYWKRFRTSASFRPPQQYKPSISETFRDFPSSSLSLLTMLLALEPPYRGSASAALQNEFFRTRPFACDLSGLPVVYKGDNDERNHPREKKKHKSSKSRQQSRVQRETQGKAVEAMDKLKLDSGSSREGEKVSDQITRSQEMGSSTGSTSSSQNPKRLTLSPPSPPVSASLFMQKSHMTDCHPAATKNVQNLYPLPTSKLKDNASLHHHGLERRSVSTSDFRRLVAEKMSKHHPYFD